MSKQTVAAQRSEPASTTAMISRRLQRPRTTEGRANPEHQPAPLDATDLTRTTLSEGGEPLASDVRETMQRRFGVDFRDVRIHASTAASAAAALIGARAFSTGRHVVFGGSSYQPRSPHGRELLAHELAHVADTPLTPSPSSGIRMGGPSDIAERRADVRAGRALGGLSPMRSPSPQPESSTALVARRQLITPLGQGGGFGGLMARDRLDRPLVPPRGRDVPLAIQAGTSAITNLSEADLAGANVDQRIEMLRELAAATWTGSSEEDAILRIIETTPPSQSDALNKRLKTEHVGSRSLRSELDHVVDLSNNLELHAVLTTLYLKTLNPSRGIDAMSTAPVLPWHNVMGFFETDAVFFATWTSDGRIRVEYPKIGLLSPNDFADETRDLYELLVYGRIFNPTDIVKVHDYDIGRLVTLTAQDLVAYQHTAVRNLGGHLATIASFALPVSAAEGVAGRLLAVTLEQVLPAAFLVVDENRNNIVQWFPTWGKRLLKFIDLVETTVNIYGFYQFAKHGAKILGEWNKLRSMRRAVRAPSPDAERAAEEIERRWDDVTKTMDELRRGGGPATGAQNVSRVPPAPGTGSASPAAPKPRQIQLGTTGHAAAGKTKYQSGNVVTVEQASSGKQLPESMRESGATAELRVQATKAQSSAGRAVSERASKTIAFGPDKASISGYLPIAEYPVHVGTDRVAAHSKEIGHELRARGGADQVNKPGGFAGRWSASHAEKQQIVASPNSYVGVSRKMCEDCVEFFSKEAGFRRRNQVVSDPQVTRVFEPDGLVTEFYRDGAVDRYAIHAGRKR